MCQRWPFKGEALFSSQLDTCPSKDTLRVSSLNPQCGVARRVSTTPFVDSTITKARLNCTRHFFITRICICKASLFAHVMWLCITEAKTSISFFKSNIYFCFRNRLLIIQSDTHFYTVQQLAICLRGIVSITEIDQVRMRRFILDQLSTFIRFETFSDMSLPMIERSVVTFASIIFSSFIWLDYFISTYIFASFSRWRFNYASAFRNLVVSRNCFFIFWGFKLALRNNRPDNLRLSQFFARRSPREKLHTPRSGQYPTRRDRFKFKIHRKKSF